MLKNLFSKDKWHVKVPTILQMEAVECGAASLAMILAYYKKYVSLAELRLACGVSRDGSKASGLLQAATQYGLEGKGYSMEAESLAKINHPCILFWEFNHFVVLQGYQNHKFYINDPAFGPRCLDQEEFEGAFTGVVLVFEPHESFVPGGVQSQFLPSLFRRLQGQESTILFLFLLSLCLLIPGVFIPLLTKEFIDDVLIHQSQTIYVPLIIGFILVGILNFFLSILRSYFINKFELFLSLKEGANFIWHILNLPIIFFTQRTPGDILSRTETTNSIALILANEVVATFLNALTVLLYTVVMFLFSPMLTFVSIFVVVLHLMILKFSAQQQINLNQSLANEDGKWHGTGVHGIQTIESVKSCGLERDLFSSWVGQFTKVMHLQQNLMKLDNYLSVLFHFLPELNTILILSLGGYLVFHGQLTLGTLIAFQSLSASLMHPFEHLSEVITKIQSMHGDMNRLDDVIRYPVDQISLTEAKETPAKNYQGQISFQDVTFGYNKNEKPLLKNFNLELSPGKWVAVVGPSCSGRTSLARIAMGLYQPWSGDVLFDGGQRSSYPALQLATSIGYVSQEIILFEGTIYENLTLWNRKIPTENIIQGAKDAMAHDLISVRAKAYETNIEEGGANFSGGEKQRLEIARALATNPSVLILDEATSALDSLTESKIIQNIKKRNCSCLIISHRLNILKECDEIIVINQGEIVQKGSYQDLIQEKDGLFLRLLSYE